MNIEISLIERYLHTFHHLVERARCAGMSQTTAIVYHMFVKRRRDPIRLTVVHRPHRPNHGTEPGELHRR